MALAPDVLAPLSLALSISISLCSPHFRRNLRRRASPSSLAHIVDTKTRQDLIGGVRLTGTSSGTPTSAQGD
ncbi:hypothetical protein Pst134EA_031606 [Puccinia striiformis f. sp. tritici]|uniref:uncharacterized protein n=1 Tax=Puccinia striiformis f. sp. tritici TaxID=168172 RepID=UPI002008E607|nr:uncharacterized protein Pst134EA_031606 [Puccinia striiformis f. sp. tritici]KAH9442729.1 hypothetical protein Pst134EA_031606 [Puccinia striiformis f. sp. tritici]